jgi:hypothetical protein
MKLHYLTKELSNFNSTISLPCIGLAICLLSAASPVKGDTTLLFDDFNGPALSSSWQANLPNFNVAQPLAGSTQFTTNIGAPHYAFQTLSGASVITLSNTLSQHTRVGWDSTQVFTGNNFTYQVRFNTLVQSSSTSIDAFLEIGVIDASNPARYDVISPYGGYYGSAQYFCAGSSIDNNYQYMSGGYQNNTWYRLVLQGNPGQDLHASLRTDAGVELAGWTYAHTADAFSSGFRIFLSQAVGEPNAPYPVDVAVDWAQLTQVPEPATLSLLGCACACWFALRRRS